MILPFSIGCVSQSSVAVSEDRSSARKPPSSLLLLQDQSTARDVDRDAAHKGAGTNKGFLPLPAPRPNLTAGFHRVIKGFRGFTSQLFAYKDHSSDEDDDDDDDDDRELQIGFPTDVQHVGHIGWDGTNTNALSNMMSWDGHRKQQPHPQQAPAAAAAPPPELFAMPTISLRQFQMAMAAQADDEDGGGYPVVASSRRSHQHLRTAAA